MFHLKIFFSISIFFLLYSLIVISYSERSVDHKRLLAQYSPFSSKSEYCHTLNYDLKGDVRIHEVNEDESIVSINEENPNVKSGGYFSPRICNSSEVPRDSVAIIIPYRDRYHHLLTFLKHMHPILTAQKLEYKMYLIHQEEGSPFNRGKLINIGFMESMRDRNWSCIIMHDVDYLPLSDKNLYTCGSQPRRLIVASDRWSFGYASPYRNFFGGVAAVRSGVFMGVNGFSNDYYGWGAEDDDLAKRLNFKGYRIDILDEEEGMKVGKYQMLKHEPAKPAEDRMAKLQNTMADMAFNGLNSLNYTLISRIEEQLYTNITVDLLYQKL